MQQKHRRNWRTYTDVHCTPWKSRSRLGQKTTCYTVLCFISDMLKLQEAFPRKLPKAPISFWHFQCRALMEKHGIFPGIFWLECFASYSGGTTRSFLEILAWQPYFHSLFTQQEVERLFFRIWNWKQQQQQQQWCNYVHVDKLKHKLLHSIFLFYFTMLCWAGSEVQLLNFPGTLVGIKTTVCH